MTIIYKTIIPAAKHLTQLVLFERRKLTSEKYPLTTIWLHDATDSCLYKLLFINKALMQENLMRHMREWLPNP